jgi:hypothetical protein
MIDRRKERTMSIKIPPRELIRDTNPNLPDYMVGTQDMNLGSPEAVQAFIARKAVPFGGGVLQLNAGSTASDAGDGWATVHGTASLTIYE